MRTSPRTACLTAALAASALSGCGSKEKPSLVERIGLSPKQERFVEVDLGSFLVPVPVSLEGITGRLEPENLIQLQIDLFAVVEPGDLKQVKELKKRNEGRLHDSVIRVCRNTAREDLLDGQKSTLKAHLLDAVQPHLGGDAVLRVGLRRVTLEEI